MTLNNLVGVNIERISPDKKAIIRLLKAAERNIVDAQVEAISAENRFDASYKAIMQIANAALQANGYRTLTSKPGHHRTMIQLLGQTLGIENDTIITLDAFRKQRNIADYSGDVVPESTVKECVEQAKKLLSDMKTWLSRNKPELLYN